jgi:hypothetical protein
VGISLHRGPAEEPGGDSLAGTLLREKGSIASLDPEDIKILGNVVLRRKPQSTFCAV